jgi:hypothetical protein
MANTTGIMKWTYGNTGFNYGNQLTYLVWGGDLYIVDEEHKKQ